jgi:arsenate reductase
MTTRIWHYAGCSTCKQALAWLRTRGVQFEAIDLVQTPPDVATLADLQAVAEVPARKLFNTSGLVYKGEGWAERVGTLSDAEIHAALSAQGRLIKRPLLLVEHDGKRAACIGFREAEWQAALGLLDGANHG